MNGNFRTYYEEILEVRVYLVNFGFSLKKNWQGGAGCDKSVRMFGIYVGLEPDGLYPLVCRFSNKYPNPK